MIVAVHCVSPPGGVSGPGSVQPLILSKPLCSAHQEAAARSASARVAAVNARQYFAVFNIPSVLPAPATKIPRHDSTDICKVWLTHTPFARLERACRNQLRWQQAHLRSTERYRRMQELWTFLFTGMGAFIALVVLAVLIGAGVFAWWTRKID